MKRIMQMAEMKIIIVLNFFLPCIAFCQYPALVDSLIVSEQSNESSIVITSNFGESRQYNFHDGKSLDLIVHSWLEHDYDSIGNDWIFEFNIDSTFIFQDSIMLTHSVNNSLIYTRNYSLESAFDNLGNRVVSLNDNLSDPILRENHIFVVNENELVSEKLETYSERLSKYYISYWQRIDKGETKYVFGLDTYYFGTQIQSKNNKIQTVITLDWRVFLEPVIDYETAILWFNERMEHDYFAKKYKTIRLYNNEVWHEPNLKKIIRAYKKKNGLIKNGHARLRI